ncbi:cation:proton antiporter [Thermoflexus sp.]|jgi:multicomponent Na+:H+ antiporter subunit F|uniref:cation:proton antiporter n=1 Tax=Thermoflexus sp. TaxID=1969742 RepID=UPI0028CF030F|nr:cation:proton antiporter [Thermoflexus sp.]MDT7948367.1 cation:proton antiporter [Thermoflexus sp.]
MIGMTQIAWIALLVMSLAVVLAFVRLAYGPTLSDRVIALDLIGTLAIGIIAVYAMVWGLPVLLDVAIVLALIGFLGTIAFASYLERRAGP